MSHGLVFIHHAPLALISHVEWTLAGISGAPQSIRWWESSRAEAGKSCVAKWSGADDSAAVLASAFMNLKSLVFEVTEHTSSGGYRYSFVPSLGMFKAATDSAGNLLIGENQLRAAMENSGSNPLKLQKELRKLLGQAWDDELEEYRERALIVGAEGDNGVVPTEAEGIANGKDVGATESARRSDDVEFNSGIWVV